MLKEIFNKCLQIQILFGFPCDIEFAVKNNIIYILQSRAITKIKYSKITDIWSTADFKDGGVSSTVCMPYMWSLYEYIWEYTLKKFIIDSKILKQNDIDKKLGDMFYGRPYWNLSIVKKAMEKVPGYKERQFDMEYGIQINYEGDGNQTKINLSSLFRIIKIALAQVKILNVRNKNAEKYKKELLNIYNDYLEQKDNKYNKNLIENIWYKLIHDDYLRSESTYFWQIFINTIHQSLYKDSLLKYVDESEYLSLLSGIDNISHLLPFYDMWTIIRKIKDDMECYKFWSENNSNQIIDYLDKDKYLMSEIRFFIKKYGYHSNKELDVSYPCYFEEPLTIIKMFQETLKLDDFCNPVNDKEKQRKQYEKQLDKIKKQVSNNKYKKIKNKIDNMRKMLWWREEFRDISTRFYYIIRIYTIKLADEYVKNNILNDINDIWYLKIENIMDFIDKKIDKKDLYQIININKKYYNSFRNYMSDNEIGSVFDLEKANSIIKKEGIYGIGCNNGIIVGTARVIESLSEIDKIQVGDILITKFTDTGWTSKFAMISGIVTEFGGILCHAAIVSREYGIPAIVCAQDITKKIKNGSIIKINGTTGEIEIIKE